MAAWTAESTRDFWKVTDPRGRTLHVAKSAGPGRARRTEEDAIAVAKTIFRNREKYGA